MIAMKHPLSIISIFLVVLVFCLCPSVSSYSPKAVNLFDEGKALIASGNYTDAVRVLDQSIAAEGTYFEAWNEKADALNRAKQYTAALSASDQALSINPAYAAGWINRGYILYNLGRYDDELKAYDRAIEIDPENADAWFNRGYALAGLGRYDEAIRSFDRVAELDPAYPNLAANRRIAETNRDASTPFVVKYAPWLILIILIAGGIIGWVYAKKRHK